MQPAHALSKLETVDIVHTGGVECLRRRLGIQSLYNSSLYPGIMFFSRLPVIVKLVVFEQLCKLVAATTRNLVEFTQKLFINQINILKRKKVQIADREKFEY